jgi:hypothetical protein
MVGDCPIVRLKDGRMLKGTLRTKFFHKGDNPGWVDSALVWELLASPGEIEKRKTDDKPLELAAKFIDARKALLVLCATEPKCEGAEWRRLREEWAERNRKEVDRLRTLSEEASYELLIELLGAHLGLGMDWHDANPGVVLPALSQILLDVAHG